MTRMTDISNQMSNALAMPCNIEAEQALVGILMYDAYAFDLLDGLRPVDFYDPFLKGLYALISDRRERGLKTDAILANDHMSQDSSYRELGGGQYLMDLIDQAPPTSGAADYAAAIKDMASRRSLISEAQTLLSRAKSDFATGASELALQAERRLWDIGSGAGSSSQNLTTGAEAIDQALEHAALYGNAPEFATKLKDLDQILGGPQRGEQTILASRPGMGKTLAALCIAKNFASAGVGVAYFSLEMSAPALGLRLACDVAFNREAEDPWNSPTMAGISTGKMTPHQLKDLAEARRKVSSWPIKLDCRPGLTVTKIEQVARRQFREWKRLGVEPGPIFIDHLGLVRPEKDRQGSRHAEVADVSRGLSEMAKRLNVPVVALCQLNRSVESREDKRPLLSDLRQAGELEEDARVVLLLHRPAYYFRTPERGESFEQEAERLAIENRDRNLLRFMVAKNSNGPTGEVGCFVDVSRSAVRDRDTSR